MMEDASEGSGVITSNEADRNSCRLSSTKNGAGVRELKLGARRPSEEVLLTIPKTEGRKKYSTYINRHKRWPGLTTYLRKGPFKMLIKRISRHNIKHIGRSTRS